MSWQGERHDHVAQLTQQISVLALPRAREEEAKKKGWWQFWG